MTCRSYQFLKKCLLPQSILKNIFFISNTFRSKNNSNTFISNNSPNQAEAKQQPEDEPVLLEKYSHSSSMLSVKNNLKILKNV